jgi:hypothetical protein
LPLELEVSSAEFEKIALGNIEGLMKRAEHWETFGEEECCSRNRSEGSLSPMSCMGNKTCFSLFFSLLLSLYFILLNKNKSLLKLQKNKKKKQQLGNGE